MRAAGVVTAVSIQCAPRPSSVQVVFLGLESYAAVTQVLSKARKMLGEVSGGSADALEDFFHCTCYAWMVGAAHAMYHVFALCRYLWFASTCMLLCLW